MNLLPKARETFLSICDSGESFGTFLSISIKFYSSEKKLDNTSFNFQKVKERFTITFLRLVQQVKVRVEKQY